MMRIAACLATERGVEVCAPVHDAFLICAPLDRLDHDIERMQQAMVEAARAVLGGFDIRTDVSITKFPDRYMDDRGTVMWQRVLDLLDQSPANSVRAIA
jgi:DNA polymerase-1